MTELLEMTALGVRTEVLRADEQECRFDVVGHARGFITQPHVHTRQTERHEVVEGSMRLVLDGVEHVLHTGDAMEVPAGTPHRQLPGPGGEGRVRVTMHPGGTTVDFLRRLAELSASGGFNRFGFPRPVALAEIVRDFGDEGHAARPSPRVQRAVSRAILSFADREYAFVDEWDVAAPREAVFAALSDARSYPDWWRPVYLDVESDGEPHVGSVSHQHFKGRLPYHLHTRSRVVRMEPPRVIEGEVDGDLRGTGIWTLSETASGTHVRFDWRVHADRRLLRLLTPVLRPALRWNHDWAIARAIAGLEPYVLAR
jgi:mannose-6-phosphate isomerase-like protein (cupin superfamily)/uncharacterized protein YndB with AHSA1/START domain